MLNICTIEYIHLVRSVSPRFMEYNRDPVIDDSHEEDKDCLSGMLLVGLDLHVEMYSRVSVN